MQSYWDSEEVFVSGDDYFERLIQDIDQAKSYITVEVYIFNDDLLGKRLAAHLIGAHKRGVKVQIIVDGIGSHQFYSSLHGVFKNQGIVVKMYNPIPFIHPFFGKLTFLKRLELLLLRMLSLNKRNHRKLITIDQNILYGGSYNFTAEHTRLHFTVPWLDMGMRVQGQMVKHAVLAFKRNWKLRDYYRYKKQVKILPKFNWRSSPLRLNHTIIKKRYFYKNFIHRIANAEKRIWFVTPYFIPRRKIIRELARAARRGVDVRLLIASKSDIGLFRTLQYFYYPYLIKAGVKVFQYTDSVLHAKNYIIDDWMTVGSTNLNHRSLIHDLEVDLVVQEEKNKLLVCEHFNFITRELKPLTEESLKSRSIWDSFLSRLYFTFRFWF